MDTLITDPDQELSDDTTVLLDWIGSQIFASESTSEQTLPLRIRNIIRTSLNTHSFHSVLQRMLYSSAKNLKAKYNGDIIQFFKWIEFSSNHLNLLYMFFKFDENDIILLKRTEFFIYQDFIISIWPEIFNYFLKINNMDDLFFVSKIFLNINLYEELDKLIFKLTKHKILSKIDSIYTDDPIYDKLENWVMNDLYPSFETLISFQNSNAFKDSLSLITQNNLVLKRIDRIYMLVQNYPDTDKTLQEFNFCLTNDNQRNLLIDTFITNLKNKLLLPSIKTIDIILYYMKTIYAFLLIDRRGVLLDKATRSIRSYLSMRNDTVEKIVNGLLCEDKNSKLLELNNELKKYMNESTKKEIFAKRFQKRTLNWQPDPIDALPDFQIGKIDDIIDSLTSIFNDNSLFINQFVNIFANDLLNIKDYDIHKIFINLELLKFKFSNNDFNQIDIMINDVVASKKLDDKMSEILSSGYYHAIHGLFLSHLYWPNLSTETNFKLPKSIETDLQQYEKSYKKFKTGRDLKLHKQQSTTNIDINVGGVVKNYTVTLDKFAVLNFLNETPVKDVKLGIICMKLGMPLLLVRSSLEFWANESVIIESNGGWKINE